MGGELAQRDRLGEWLPLAFFSHSLSATEKKYSAFDRELLAMFLAVKHFRHYLEGRKFCIFTDHKPLTFALTSSTDRSPRQTRQLSYIAEFTGDVRHIKGERNIVADALSRPAQLLPPRPMICNASVPPMPAVDFAALALSLIHI